MAILLVALVAAFAWGPGFAAFLLFSWRESACRNPYGTWVRTTPYFDLIRQRPDRAMITDDWLQRAIESPLRRTAQADGRIRLWMKIPEMAGRVLRVVVLADGTTVHNAFFDRRFSP